MNKEQAEFFKRKTCYFIDSLGGHYDELKEHGMPAKDLKMVDDFLNNMFALNQKYVKLEKRLG